MRRATIKSRPAGGYLVRNPDGDERTAGWCFDFPDFRCATAFCLCCGFTWSLEVDSFELKPPPGAL